MARGGDAAGSHHSPASSGAISERQATERAFYDRHYAGYAASHGPNSLVVDPQRPPVYSAGMDDVIAYTTGLLGDLRGRRLLSVGCGVGTDVIWLAHRGAHIVATDISAASLRLVRRRAEINGVAERIELLQVPAESLHRVLPADRFDLAYGTEVLHHLDVERFASALRSVLRPGGRAVFLEPIAFVPLLQRLRESGLVQRLLPVYRHTPTERILTPIDLVQLSRQFSATLRPYGVVTFLQGPIERSPALVRGALYRAAGIAKDLNAAVAWEQFVRKLYRLDWGLTSRLPSIRALSRRVIITLEDKRL